MCPLFERRGWAHCTGQRPSASQRGDRGGRERGRSCMSRQVVKGMSVRLCYSRLEPIARSLGTQSPTQNESHIDNGLSSPPRKRGSRGNRCRLATSGFPLSRRCRGNDEKERQVVEICGSILGRAL